MSEQVERLRSAFASDGFAFATRAPSGLTFSGAITVRDRIVRLRVVYPDLAFVDIPTIFVDNPEVLGRKVFPHLDEANELCVVDRQRFLADRYQVAEVGRGLVMRARQNLELGLQASATAEIAAEFPQHWGGALIGCEFDAAYAGPVDYWVDKAGRACTRPHRNVVRKKTREARQPEIRVVPGFVIKIDRTLSFEPHQGRPSSFGELVQWAREWDQAMAEAILHHTSLSTAGDIVCLINAPNGVVGGMLKASDVAPAIVKSMSRPPAWARLVRAGAIDAWRLQRMRGRIVTLDHALNRNFSDAAPLNGLKIALVGCGAIGGFLARDLTQIGAGRRAGRLELVDNDNLETTNLGRHWLGIEEVNQNKAAACKAKIDRELPGAEICVWEQKIQQRSTRLAEFDLVIDATGEQAVGDLLNQIRIDATRNGERWPALLHVWIEGRGAAVQTYFSSDPAFACFRCLQPNLEEVSRVSPLRPGTPNEVDAGCGESTFTPYGPAAPMIAAGLATAHIAEWAAGHCPPLLRTVNIDLESTVSVKPKNPERSERCPACAQVVA